MSTVHICLNDILGVAVACEVIFYPGDTPFCNGAALTVSGACSIRLDAEGNGSVTLLPGRYTVRFSGITSNTDTLLIQVPNDNEIYPLSELIYAGNWVLPMRDFLQKSKNLSDLADPAAAFDAIKQSATSAKAGVISLASQEEVAAGTNATKAVTPATLAQQRVKFSTVADTAARLALTPAQVSVGDVVEQEDTRAIYQVLNATLLNQETSYVEIGTRPAPSGNLAYGVLAFWNLDEESGTRVDATGNGNALSDTNGVGFTQGIIGNAAQATEAGQGLNCVNDLALRNLSAYSVSTWFKAVEGTDCIISDWADDWELRVHPDWPGLMFWNSTTTEGERIIPFGRDLRDNQWHHVVFTVDGTALCLYLDGALIAAKTINWGSIQWPLDTFALMHTADNNDSGPLSMDATGVWNRALSSVEVSLLYNNGNGLAFPFA